MTQATPPFTSISAWPEQLKGQGFVLLAPEDVAKWCGADPAELETLVPTWDVLPIDGYLKDGGRYRRRRHSSYEVEQSEVTRVPHRAHWQPVSYNALHGGMQRWFEPLEASWDACASFRALLVGIAQAAAWLHGSQKWFVEAHQFRIDTTDGIGRPTPEGAHRDGVDVVAVVLVRRRGIKGGETRVFDAHGPWGQRFTLEAPWSLLLLDDAKVIHETTPIQPLLDGGWRDTLVLTCRGGGFQDASEAQA